MVLRNSGRVGSRRFFDRIDRKAEGSGSNKRTGPFVVFGGDALPTIPSGNEVHKDFFYSNMEETLVIHIAFICSDTAFGFMHLWLCASAMVAVSVEFGEKEKPVMN